AQPDRQDSVATQLDLQDSVESRIVVRPSSADHQTADHAPLKGRTLGSWIRGYLHLPAFMHRTLGRKLLAEMALDDTAAFFQLKELLGIAAGGIPNNGTLPTEPGLLGGFRLAQAALYELRQGRKNLREDGILYKGRPAFMTDDLLQAMQREMEEQQDRKSVV